MIQIGDTVEFINKKGIYAANNGARAIVINWHKNDLISVKWIRNGEDNGQEDGEYFYSLFKKVEEVSTQKEDRILIENEKDMKFEQGNTLIFEGGKDYAAKKGARAIFTGHDGDYIFVKWVRDELSGEQMDGKYDPSMFKKVEEVSEQNKSDMKFDFEKGKKLLMEYFQSDLERGEAYTLQTIKGSDNFEDIENEIDSFRYFKNDIENTIQLINQTKTLKEVFVALIDTDLEDDEETILSFFIEGLK